MDFAALLKESWERFFAEIVQLVVFTLVGVLLCLTIVLIPCVIAGWSRGILDYLRDGAPPAFEELWCFDDYLQVVLLLVVGGILIAIGYALLIVPGVVLSVWWLYSLFFLVDQRIGFFDALSASKDAVSESGFFEHLVVLLLATVLSGLGTSLSGVGTLFTTPFSILLLALVYLDLPGAGRAGDRIA